VTFPARVAQIQAALRAEQLRQPGVVTAAYAATVRAQVAILTVLNTQIQTMDEQVEAHFGQHPDAEIYRSQPGLGVVLGARVLAEFGDDTTRYADAKSRKNYAGTSPITRASGKKKTVVARYVHNDRLVDALGLQAFAALRHLANRLVGILHGCLKTGTRYDEDTAWAHHQNDLELAA